MTGRGPTRRIADVHECLHRVGSRPDESLLCRRIRSAQAANGEKHSDSDLVG